MINIETLKKQSVRLSGPTMACWPQYDRTEFVDMTSVAAKFAGCYAVNNSTICFVGKEGGVFVTPYTREALEAIREAGLERKDFYVPFSNCDYPVDEKGRWFDLRRQASESYLREYEYDCANWCESHGVGALDKTTLDLCFKLPREGVLVRRLGVESIESPACNELVIDCFVAKKLGRYSRNNGKVAFVYRDGHTYVAEGAWILDELKSAGYVETFDLFVPFSNGEEIVDPVLAHKWASCRINKE